MMPIPQQLELVLQALPHRYPFLLVDGVLARTQDTIRAFKNLSNSEWVFQGHFPGNPVFPGVLQLEGMAQAGGILLLAERATMQGVPLLLGIDRARFKKPAFPGDRLVYDVRLLEHKSGVFRLEGEATVEGEITSQARFLVGLGDAQGRLLHEPVCE